MSIIEALLSLQPLYTLGRTTHKRNQMKQLQILGYGDIKNNLAFAEVEKPQVSSNQILIKVHYASLNPIDYKIIEGVMKPIKKLKFPAKIGFDFSGKIVQVGEKVTKFSVDDEIYGRVPDSLAGTFSEYISIDNTLVSKIPKNLTLKEASAIPLVSVTSLQALEKANIKANDKVLIHAGSGGVGSIAIQYAKSKKAYVYTTTSTQNIAWVKELGADRVIDYKKEDYREIVKGLDIVFDTLGKNYTYEACEVLKKGGRIVSVAGPIDKETAIKLKVNFVLKFILSLMKFKLNGLLKKKSITYSYIYMAPDTKQLNQISQLIEQEKIRPIIDKEYKFDDAIQALLYLKKGRAKGKVILKIT